MRRWVIATAVLATALDATTSVAAPPAKLDGTIEGQVVHSQSRWTADGSRIVTVSTVRASDATQWVVRQPGGAVGGIGMRVIPAAPVLEPGDRVRATISRGWIRSVERLDRARRPSHRSSSRPGTAPLGFVRTTNDLGAPLYWSSGCVFVTFDAAGTTDVPGTAEFDVMNASLMSWQGEIQSCSYLELVSDEPVEGLEVGLDGLNLVKFRHDRWCAPASGDEPEECHSMSAAGLTTLFFVQDEDSSRNGELLDADIEMNAVNFSVSVEGNTSGTGCMADLANTFTHEVGHLLGLDHTCWDGRGERPVDDQGNPVPSCGGALSAEITEATMYPFQDCGETKKATLEADDVAGVCAIYPIGADPGSCERAKVSGGGCCEAGDSPDPASSLLLLGALIVSALRRRRSLPPSPGCP